MRSRDLVLLALVLVALLAALLVWPPIATRGEAREGLVVRELAAGGDWVLPRRQGVIASKPPLYHWLAVGGVRLLGWSDVAVRLPSVLAAWIVALETFAVALLVAGRGTAWLAVGILFATWGFSRSALEARVDMLFSAGVAGAIAGLAWWRLRGAPHGRSLFWLAAAAAALTKGPVGFVLPALVAVTFLWTGRDLRLLRSLWSWPAAATALLATGGWYAAATAAGGREFVAVQVMKENVDRFVGRGEFAPSRMLAWLLMPRYFLGHLAPWHLAIVHDWRRWWGGARATAADRVLHCWWLGILVFFTLAAGKRSVYLLPLYPAVAVLAARTLLGEVSPGKHRAAIAAVVALAALGMLGASYYDAVEQNRAQGLLPLARATASAVPPDAPLYASQGLSENDVLVLAYLLERPLLRRRIVCDGTNAPSYYLRPVPSGGGAIAVERLAAVGHRELVRCPSN